jgi:thermostable 8-oxoguanine DNA glycosylase
MHTRPGQRYACLDTHILKFLRHRGIMTPKSTPGKKSKKYIELEREFLKVCDLWNIQPYDLDLQIWNHYRQTPDIEFKERMIQR